MYRVTADSNIYVSAFNWGGNPERLIEMAREGRIELAVSEPLGLELLILALNLGFDNVARPSTFGLR